jgi:tetratricopeptide (TPR) repeat protein
MNHLGIILQQENKYDEAESLYRTVAEAMSRTLGPDNRGTLLAKLNIAVVNDKTGQFAEAEKIYKDVLSIQIRTLGRDHPDTALSLYDLAESYQAQKRYAEAISFYRQALDSERKSLGPSHPYTLDTLYYLACILNLNGERESAFKTLHELVDAGFSDAHRLETDEELSSLHNDPRFEAILADLQKRGASQKSN